MAAGNCGRCADIAGSSPQRNNEFAKDLSVLSSAHQMKSFITCYPIGEGKLHSLFKDNGMVLKAQAW